ncbi:hypothetical protein EWM64_g2950 [Hericium alpestre]|uniref:Uncharacterized protein n=1 Tax=Hericium alpestre TaxID=135208 RepID=A0A4Z0A402_9AGAM|nr:hypothetical protein EWM64_g2950 [Hericium alpestre]
MITQNAIPGSSTAAPADLSATEGAEGSSLLSAGSSIATGIAAPSQVQGDKDLREKYHGQDTKQHSSSIKAPRAKRPTNEVDPIMSDFVNAKGCGLGCRRRVPRVYFGGTCPAEEYKACQRELPSGCPRCKPTTPHLCCDICVPTLLSDMGLQLEHDKVPSVPVVSLRCSNITQRKATQADHSFSRCIFDWRDIKAKSKLGHAVYENLGPAIFLSDDLVDHLVLCAGAGKLVTIADILRETHWNHAEEHGEDILKIVKDTYC